MNPIGVVCPRDGQFFAIEASHVDSAVFQVFLNEANDCAATTRKKCPYPRQRLVAQKKTMEWGLFEPVFLPPYSPDLNPIERIWLIMKAKWFNNHVCKNRNDLMDRLQDDIRDIYHDPKSTKITSSIANLF